MRNEPPWFIKECETLGLLTTRMPRFSQLFFHDFEGWEVHEAKGQDLGGSVSRRAAEAYLRSGVRLQSTCGISDIWYWYVESNRDLFTKTTPLSPAGESPPSPEPKPFHPPMDPYQIELVYMPFPWIPLHKRPKPRRRVYQPPAPSPPSFPTDAQDGQPEFVAEVEAKQSPPPQPKEDISEYTEDEEAVGREVSSVASGEDFLEDWPETFSFQSELQRTMFRFEAPEIHPEGEDQVKGEDLMEGVELSQPTQVRVHGGGSGAPSLEGISEDEEEMEDEEDEEIEDEEDEEMEDEESGEDVSEDQEMADEEKGEDVSEDEEGGETGDEDNQEYRRDGM